MCLLLQVQSTGYTENNLFIHKISLTQFVYLSLSPVLTAETHSSPLGHTRTRIGCGQESAPGFLLVSGTQDALAGTAGTQSSAQQGAHVSPEREAAVASTKDLKLARRRVIYCHFGMLVPKLYLSSLLTS